MNLLIIEVVLFSLISFKPSEVAVNIDKCDVKEIYEIVNRPRESVVLTTSGSLVEVDQILIPVRMKEGTYEVEVTRKGKNVYQLVNMEYVLETKYCNEYARRDDALLKVENHYGSTKGVLIFE